MTQILYELCTRDYLHKLIQQYRYKVKHFRHIVNGRTLQNGAGGSNVFTNRIRNNVCKHVAS